MKVLGNEVLVQINRPDVIHSMENSRRVDFEVAISGFNGNTWGSGLPIVLQDLVGADGASLTYEGYRGRLEGDRAVWDRTPTLPLHVYEDLDLRTDPC